MSDFFPADAGLRPVLTGSALPNSHSWHWAPPKGGSWWATVTTLQRFAWCCGPKDCSRPWTNRPRPRGVWPPGTCTSGLSRPRVAPRARRIWLPGQSDDSQGGTLARWIDAVMGCT